MFEKPYYDICSVDNNECDGICRKKNLYIDRVKCTAVYVISREEMVKKKLGKDIKPKQLNKIMDKYEPRGDGKSDRRPDRRPDRKKRY